MDERRPLRVLLVDDDETFRRVFGGALEEEGFQVETAADGLLALDRMNRRAFDLALVDLKMPRMDGLSLLAEMQRRHPTTIPIVLTGFGSIPSTVEAMRRNAFDVVSKSAPPDQVIATLRRTADERHKSRGGDLLGNALLEHDAFFGMVGKSATMRKVFRAVERYQAGEQPVLISGESGTGKELVARALHAGGQRQGGPMVAVNCASLRENFVENELFGHVRGAFTGALSAKPGLFSLANGGSFHIDEVAELPEGAQAALLRVLENGTYRPLGGSSEVQVDARVFASTNGDLEQMVDDRLFRRDLYYRLCVCRIELPPLRERVEDIPLLINSFLDRSAAARKNKTRIADEAVDALLEHDWPGNVRELFNTLERATMLAEDGVVLSEHLGRLSRKPKAREVPEAAGSNGSNGDLTLDELERNYVRELLRRTEGNISEVARIMAVDPTTVRRKLRRWGDVRPK
ncbi:MAG: sigma-54-dependent Fis family transcriptional regulator [Deltaproteobacteria bacterium]|nr:sigma-54-dependent Fis family transcriptional regulator [Deltaproteobacteria bacterium]